MSEQDARYMTGFPSTPGWYDVLVDGVEDRMVCRFCRTCGLFVWEDINGVRATGTVLWMPGSWDMRP